MSSKFELSKIPLKGKATIIGRFDMKRMKDFQSICSLKNPDLPSVKIYQINLLFERKKERFITK